MDNHNPKQIDVKLVETKPMLTGWYEPIDMGLFEVSTERDTYHISARIAPKFECFGTDMEKTFYYECWALLADKNGNAETGRNRIELFHFSTKEPLLLSDLKQDIKDNFYYVEY